LPRLILWLAFNAIAPEGAERTAAKITALVIGSSRFGIIHEKNDVIVEVTSDPTGRFLANDSREIFPRSQAVELLLVQPDTINGDLLSVAAASVSDPV
jgi:hypothetical protein